MITFTLSEPSSTFTLADITVTGGQLSEFTSTSSSVYKANFIATADSTTAAKIKIAANTYTDTVGNTNIASTELTLTVDTIKPTVTISSSKNTLKANETAVINFNLSKPSNDFSLSDITVVGGSLSNLVMSGTSYTATLTPSLGFQGNVTIEVAKNTFTDSVANGNEASIRLVIPVDSLGPTIIISSNDTLLNSTDTAMLTFTISEAVSDFTANNISVTGGVLSNFTGTGAIYTASFTPTANSTTAATINVDANLFTDSAGNKNSAATELSINIDTVNPTATITASNNTVNATDDIIITITLSELSADFTLEDISVTGGTLSSFSGFGVDYNVKFTPFANTVTTANISVAPGKYSDNADNFNSVSSTTSVTVNTTLPSISIVSDHIQLKQGEQANLSFLLSENSNNFTQNDIVVTGGALSAFNGSNNLYTAVFIPDENSVNAATINVAANTFTDNADNANTAAEQLICLLYTSPSPRD